ncbi:uncharacterized protein LOC116853412 [Odontomachus brunneus]|uniref:uncharacterized protein LOC116853412 n=1 Tax=Odontomachus brunneus TaxID=486640 RepID=UPI0013F1BF6B|nr:uncharacterized protein LOC116853412 [Odontomachus brunneus]XP_032690373.1 uncharacterized protein LOC116853412 [Odontomachus brunneus]XP_032690374.1 uncharacterized protein LOC116853412 [Odontomachus brunneus]
MELGDSVYQLVAFSEEKLTPDRYNKFFNPNICHVCKLTYNENFIICDQCFMISYCSGKHRLLHLEQHMQICTVIANYLKKDLIWEIHRLSQEEWIQSRKEFIDIIKGQLSRDLEPYEMQMIMFASSCLICHQQQNLRTCMTCYSSNYCGDHAKVFESHHSSTCKELLLYLNLAIKVPHGIKFESKFSTFPDRNRPIKDMDSFIQQYYRSRRQLRSLLAIDYFYTEYVSGPLTLYYGMKNASLLQSLQKNTCVIHIIAASPVDRKYLPAWELLLHLLHKIKDLKIVLIGPELTNESDNIEICFRCNTRCSQKFSFECYRMLYHNYVDSVNYKRPNLIIGFQTDFSDGKRWSSKSFLKLRDQGCPLLLTAKSKFKSNQNISKIGDVLGLSISPVYHEENKFGSARPCRDFETNSVSYCNKVLAIIVWF